MFVLNRMDDDVFARETTGSRQGHRQTSDQEKHGRDGHGAIQSAEIAELSFPESIEDDAGRHPEKRLVENVAEGGGGGSADGIVSADTGRADHETDLVDDSIRENAADVALHECIDDAVDGHGAADPDERLPSGIAAEEGVDRGFCRVGAEDEPSGDARGGVGIRQPGGQWWCPAVHEDAKENEPGASVIRGLEIEAVEGDTSVLLRDGEDHPGEEEKSPHEVDHDVAEGRTFRLLGVAGEDDKG